MTRIEDLLGSIELEVPCDTCGGSCGDHGDDDRWQNCADCGGAGFVPTEFGVKVLALMEHNLGPMLRNLKAGA